MADKTTRFGQSSLYSDPFMLIIADEDEILNRSPSTLNKRLQLIRSTMRLKAGGTAAAIRLSKANYDEEPSSPSISVGQPASPQNVMPLDQRYEHSLGLCVYVEYHMTAACSNSYVCNWYLASVRSI